jgi:hypothetical protein
MGSTGSAHPPVVRVSERAKAELRAGEALVFDWTGLAFCCAVAGEVSLHPTTFRRHNARQSTCRLPVGDGPLVVARRRAYPVLVGHDIGLEVVALARGSEAPQQGLSCWVAAGRRVSGPAAKERNHEQLELPVARLASRGR